MASSILDSSMLRVSFFMSTNLGTKPAALTALEVAINKKTKAIAIVHYLGVPVNMPKVVEIAKKYNLFLLEDCALAPGAKINGTHAVSYTHLTLPTKRIV